MTGLDFWAHNLTVGKRETRRQLENYSFVLYLMKEPAKFWDLEPILINVYSYIKSPTYFDIYIYHFVKSHFDPFYQNQ